MSIDSRYAENSVLARRSALLIALSVAACGAYDGASSGDEPLAIAEGSDGIPWETFLSSVGRAPNGALVVESDMAFSDEAAVRRYWEAHRAPGRGEELTVRTRVVGGIVVDDIWPIPQNVSITYCVGTEFNSTQMAALLPALDAATDAWSRMAGVRYLRVTPTGACDANNNAVVFDIQRVPGSGANAIAFFPSDLRSERTLFVFDVAFTTTAGGRTLTGILTHELGHTLGFRHEHIWIDCESETTSQARQVTSYDEMSVMHYPQCRSPQGGGYALTSLDIAGSMLLYGPSPALIMSAL